MNLLNACLALVLTLGVFASVVTVLVEMIHQVFAQRARDLRGMLGFVFDKVFPKDALARAGLDAAALRTEFADVLRTDKLLHELVQQQGVVMKFAAERIASDTSIGIEDLLRRLPRAAVYRDYLAKLEDGARDATVKALAEQFGRTEETISAFFRMRAKASSFLVGALLALAVNVDAVRLFEYFAASPEQTAQAITRVQGLLEDARKPAEDGTAASAAVSDQAGEIRAMLQRLRGSQAFGLPLGWAYYPYCLPQAGAEPLDERCREAQAVGGATSGGLALVHAGGRPLLWLLSAIVTGFLIGLGGPYWFDLAMSLTRLRDFLKTGQAKPATPVARPDPDALVAAFLKRMDANRQPESQAGS